MAHPTTTCTARELLTKTPDDANQNCDLLWSALTADSGCAVVVYDSKGRITCANKAASNLLQNGSTEDMASLAIHDIMPAAIAEERLACARKVLETGEPMIIDGMLAGRLTRTTLRPVHGESPNEHRVLETIRTIAVEEPRPETDNYVRAKTDDEGVIGNLTAREREVLFHIGRGLSTADIASTLGRSTKTVEWHRVSLGNKLAITNRVELARIAIKAGVTGIER